MSSKASRAATSRPLKNMAFFDDDDSDDEIDTITYDDASSAVKSIEGSMDSRMKADTFALAEFLATTSPEEFAKPSKQQQQQFQRASKLISKLRKRTAKAQQQRSDSASIRSGHTSISSQPGSKPKHIPLPEYHPPEPIHVEHPRTPNALRDSGVYSETSEKDIPPPPVPPVPAQSFHDLEFPMPPSVPAKSQARQPRRPAPLPAAVASAAIAVATSDRSPSLRSIPAAALKRRSIVRARNAEVQTEATEATETTKASRCPHCRQCINSNDKDDERRLSCPPALAPGKLLQRTAPTSEETKMLMAMIEKLQMQLAEEQQSRKKLELAMTKHQQAQQKAEQVAQERNRWKGDCLWLQDRIALLPE